jgi:S-disulfanyl-L-cysteine oxidoreductase SoxD
MNLMSTFVRASLLLGTCVLVATVDAQQVKTQWDSVYTKTQASRGQTLYSTHCAGCHGANLGGGEMAPALAGGDFNANWNELSLGDLFERMRVSMPQNNPGSLTQQQNADILAYMLEKGDFPPGDTELPAQAVALGSIKYMGKKPAH